MEVRRLIRLMLACACLGIVSAFASPSIGDAQLGICVVCIEGCWEAEMGICEEECRGSFGYSWCGPALPEYPGCAELPYAVECDL